MIECPYSCGVHMEERDLLVCRPRGELTATQMSDITICRECIVKAGLQQIDRFHDLRDITSIHLGFEDVRQLAYSEALLRRQAPRQVKACYLVPNSLLYGTIRMYQALIEGYGVEVHVGYDLDELVAVLGVDKSALLEAIRMAG